MVRPERVFRIRAIGLQKDKEWFISTIHQLGSLHVDDVTEKIKSEKAYAALRPDVPLGEVERVSELLMRVNFLASVFSSINGCLRPSRVLPRQFSLSSAINESKSELAMFEAKVVEAHDALKNVEERIAENRRAQALLERFSVAFNTKLLAESAHVRVMYGRALKKDCEEFRVPKALRKRVIICTDDASKDAYDVLFAYHVADGPAVAKMAKELNMEREKAALPGKAEAELEEEMKELRKLRKQLTSDLHVLGQKHGGEVAYLQRLLTAAKERGEISTRFAKTKQTFCVEAFIPERKMPKLEKRLADKSIILEKEKPEKAPVLLKNPPYVRSFEHITTMFGYPSYNGVDPTLFVSLFFPFFFGFMLSDVGYGAMVLVAAFLFWLFRSKVPLLKDVAVIATACGTSTVIFGMLFGSFFGSLIRIPALWLDPFESAMTILVTVIGVGIVHANLGIVISALTNISMSNWRKLVLNNVSLIVLQLAVVFFVMRQPVVGGIMLAMSAIMLVMKSSLFGIMEISGFAGLILSYARILALSLATGGIALAVNIIAEQFFQLGAVGFVIAPLVILAGHLFNFVLNIIGSTVNSARLHFVEFFSLFFIEGGKKFVPFRIKQE